MSAAEALGNHLWQSTLLCLAIWAATRLLHGHSATLRHRLWLAASLKFVVPFDLFVLLGRRLGRQVLPLDLAPVTQVVELAGVPFSHPAMVAIVPSLPEGSQPWLLTATIAWAAGTAICVWRWGTAWRRTTRTVHAARRAQASSMPEFLERLCQEQPRLDLVVCDSRMEPGLFGIRRPVLMWPRALTSRLSHTEVAAIVAHERAHHVRQDNLTTAIHEAIAAMFWFHPAVWWVGRALRIERERACDEVVLRHGHAAHAYASSIVKTCEFCLPANTLVLTGVTGRLSERIAGILAGHVGAGLTAWGRITLIVSGLGVAMLPVAAGTASMPKPGFPASIGAAPAFSAVTLTPGSASPSPKRLTLQRMGTFTAENLTVRELIVRAYQTQAPLVIGGPSWLDRDTFNISAAGSGFDHADTMEMLRALLRERFGLEARREIRRLPVFNLISIPGHAPLRESIPDTACAEDAGAGIGVLLAGAPSPCGYGRIQPGRIRLSGHTMAELAALLGSLPGVDRPVVDRTGLRGRLDVDVAFDGSTADFSSEGVSRALRQIGLDLERSTQETEVLVVENARRPLAG